MLKYWRLWLLLLILLGSALAIGVKSYPYGRSGVEIVYVSADSAAKGVLEQGMLITAVNGQPVKSTDDWNAFTANLSGVVQITANGNQNTFTLNGTNSSLGVDVMNLERTNLEFGLDLRGGTRIILRPNETNITKDMVDQTVSTLRTRANLYGLKEINIYPVSSIDGYYIQIDAAGVGRDIVNNLLSKQGKFEAKVDKPVEINDNKGLLQLGQNTFPVNVYNQSIEINGTVLQPNETIEVAGIRLEYINITGNKLLLLANVYEGSDIEIVYTDPQRSGLRPVSNAYQFYFVVSVSASGAQRFADVTAGIPKYLDVQSGEEYLDSKIYLYLDGQLVSDLRIGADLGGKVYQTPQVTGARPDKEEALQEKLNLQTILRSGALPTKLETASVDVISPTLGAGFFSSALYTGALAALMVILVVFIRYRNLKTAIPIALVGMSEVLIILGIAAVNDATIWAIILFLDFILIATAWWKKHEVDITAWIGALLIPLLGMLSWTIDLASIGGIIAALGTSVDHQIIITDEAMAGKEKKIYTMKEKIKRAFFIIFGAASTVVAAMLPLMFLGIGLVRGFAITTTTGILVGILITRPAYAAIVGWTMKEKQ